MADLTQTAANVLAQSGAKIDRTGVAGASLTRGMPVYIDPADYKAKIADNNVSATLANVYGLALGDVADGQPVAICTEGDINIGATLVVGETYVLSATAGKICPIADVSTNYVTILGVAISASLLRLKPIVSGIQHA